MACAMLLSILWAVSALEWYGYRQLRTQCKNAAVVSKEEWDSLGLAESATCLRIACV